MNTTPDSEETERKKLIFAFRAAQSELAARGLSVEADALHAVSTFVNARRLSESEIRREWGEGIIRALEDLPGEDGEAVSARSREGYLLAISESVEEVRAMLATPSPEEPTNA